MQLIGQLHASGGWRVHLATLSDAGPLLHEVVSSVARDCRTYPLRRFADLQTVRHGAMLARFLQRERIMIVHAHGFYPSIFGIAAATLCRVPVRIASKRESVGLRAPGHARLERATFRVATQVVTNCVAIRQQLEVSGVPASKLTTIYNGLAMDRVAPRARGRLAAVDALDLRVAPSDRFVTMVANLELRVKDHYTFLRAAQRVHAAEPDVRFLVAGDGVLLEEMRELAQRLGIGARVHFLGRCAHIAELLFLSEICVLSSTSEGFPNVVLEYMGAARPVVATDVGGVAEAVTDGTTGYLVTARDYEMMSARVLLLLRERIMAQAMGEAGRARVAALFSIELQLEQTVALYEAQLALAAFPAGPRTNVP